MANKLKKDKEKAMNCYYCKYSYPRATTQRFNTVFNPCQNYPPTPRPFILAPSSSFNSAPKSLSRGERGVNLSPTKRCRCVSTAEGNAPPAPIARDGVWIVPLRFQSMLLKDIHMHHKGTTFSGRERGLLAQPRYQSSHLRA